jgi:hypothetical protein
MLIERGVLEFGSWIPACDSCPNGAEVEVATMWDEAPGPRFYCRRCAVEFLNTLGFDARFTPHADADPTAQSLASYSLESEDP